MPSTTVILGLLIPFLHLCGSLAALHAILTVRTAQGAIAWAISLVSVPYLTLLPYLVFGRSRFAGYIESRRQVNKQMRKALRARDWKPWKQSTAAAWQVEGNSGLTSIARLTHTPCLGNHRVHLLVDGNQAFERMLEAIGQARHTILVQFFIVRDDQLGRRLQQALLDKASQGLQVLFLFDAIGSHGLPRPYVEKLRQGGVRIEAFATRPGVLNRFQLNFRNHRKILVIDGNCAFTGGLNVGDEYLGHKPPLSPWRDTHLELHGPAATHLQMSFAEDWYWAARELPPLLPPQAAPSGAVRCQVIACGPADSQETCSLFFVEAINSARWRIWLTSPYFIPDEAVMSAMRLAVLRGVDVRLIIPARPDHRVVFEASSLYAYEAVHAGIKVYRYQPGFLHQKVMLIDDQAAAIGSANLDNRSFRLNFEASVLVLDRDFAHQVEHMLEKDLLDCKRISSTAHARTPYWRRLVMRLTRLFAPIL